MATLPTLREYYQSIGLSEDAWHVGPEHPALENFAIRTLDDSPRSRILEVGVQSGGFAVPVILAVARRPEFSYVGVDNLAYANAVPLRLVADYLTLHGVSKNVRFVETESTAALATLAPASFDLILLDHYKPKYATDLFVVCGRGLLAPNGTILMHDVLAHAAPDWQWCARVCRAFGYAWTINPDVPGGVAVVKHGTGAASSPLSISTLGMRIRVRWAIHATVMTIRRYAGRTLRALGLR